MMNRSAKTGARSSLHYGGEGVLTHPVHQGVCGRHGTEAMDVTQGGLDGCNAQGAKQAGTISEERSVPVGPSSRRRVARYLEPWGKITPGDHLWGTGMSREGHPRGTDGETVRQRVRAVRRKIP